MLLPPGKHPDRSVQPGRGVSARMDELPVPPTCVVPASRLMGTVHYNPPATVLRVLVALPLHFFPPGPSLLRGGSYWFLL